VLFESNKLLLDVYMEIEGKTAIVTGGAGFIGSHIVKRLANGDNKVTVIDALTTGSIDNLREVEGRYEFFRGRAKIIVDLPKADVVFHQGIGSSTPLYRTNRKLVAECIEDFIYVLEYCVRNEARLVFASSSSIYNRHKPPHKEEMIPFVTDFYTEARYSMERLADLYNQMFGLKYAALRYFSIYGPGEESKKSFANMVSQIMWKALLNKELNVYGDGSQRRDLVNIEDAVSANMRAYCADVNGVFNVGNGISYSFNEMISKVKEVTGKEVKVRYIENPLQNYVDVTEAETPKMLNVLGFKPSVELNAGIKSAFDYYSKLERVPDIF